MDDVAIALAFYSKREGGLQIAITSTYCKLNDMGPAEAFYASGRGAPDCYKKPLDIFNKHVPANAFIANWRDGSRVL